MRGQFCLNYRLLGWKIKETLVNVLTRETTAIICLHISGSKVIIKPHTIWGGGEKKESEVGVFALTTVVTECSGRKSAGPKRPWGSSVLSTNSNALQFS